MRFLLLSLLAGLTHTLVWAQAPPESVLRAGPDGMVHLRSFLVPGKTNIVHFGSGG